MSVGLLKKEAQEHGVVLLAMLAISALALTALLIDSEEQGARFIALVRYLYFAGTLVVLIIANRLFVREYAGRTQLFLEGLPVSRASVFATKWVLGCALALLATAAAWLANYGWILRREVLPLAQALGTLWSVLAYTFAIWSFAAMAGMLGRYRYVAWAAAALAVFTMFTIGGVAPGDLPVLRLLGPDVQMAQGIPEARAFIAAASIALVCIVAASALALLGAGATASALAQRMTAREIVFIVAAALALITVSWTIQPKPQPPPFEFVQNEPHRGEVAAVGVMPTPDLDLDASNALARTLVEDLDSFVRALNLDVSPTAFIVPQQGLDRFVMQRAPLNSTGIVIKIAPDAPKDAVRALVLHSLLGDYTLGRGYKEDRHVFLDGVSSYWALRDDPEGRSLWALRAAAIRLPVNEATLNRWSTTSEHLGDCASQALALGVFDALVAQLGQERALELMRRMFPKPPDDIRALFEEKPDELLEEFAVPWQALAAAVRAQQDAVRTEQRSALARRPQLVPSVKWHDSPEEGLKIDVALAGAQQFAAYYRTLEPWTADVLDMPRLDVRGERATLPFSPPRGARVLVVLEIEDSILGCPTRVHAERMRLR